MFGVFENVHTGAVAIGLPRRTTGKFARTVLTGLTARTRCTTNATVRVVGLQVCAGSIAAAQPRGALARAALAGLTARANFAASTAVLTVGGQALAGSCTTGLARATSRTTRATVLAVFEDVHARSVAQRLTAGTTCVTTNTTLTGLRGRALGSTSATVGVVGVGVDTHATAIFETSRARARAAGTDLSTRTLGSTSAAVVGVVARVDTSTTAHRLA